MIWLFDSTRPCRTARVLGTFVLLSLVVAGSAWAQAPRSLEPPPGSMKLPGGSLDNPKLEPSVEPAQLPPPTVDDATRPASLGGDDASNPIPLAKDKPGAAPAPASADGPSEGDSFALPMDRLSMGRQDLKLSIEVQQAGTVLNLGREMTVNLVVKNSGNVEAVGVTVVYKLPDGLELVSSVPEPLQDPVNKANYYWKKSTLAVGGEWVIPVKVKASKVIVCEHAATVTAKAGARARLIVQEPKLKVEQVVEPTRLLKNKQVSIRISVTNMGSGPARNVVVQANLSDGLRSLDGDRSVEQTIPVIQPRQTIDLDTLVVDTLAGGQQSSTVAVSSPDVVAVAEDAKSVKAIEVISPKLVVKLAGHENRWTDQKNDYTLTVSNTGTAPVENVKVVATMPTTGGRLTNIGDNEGVFDKQGRKILWNIPRLEPDGVKEYTFTYQTGGPGLYTTLAEATSAEMRETARVATDVKGLAVLVVKMNSSNPVIDINDTTTFDVQIRNFGTKDATKILLKGTMSPNLLVTEITGSEEVKAYKVADGGILFPMIDRLAPGATLTLSIEAKAVAKGSGMCRIQLDHTDLPHSDKPTDDDLIHAVAHTTITGSSPKPGNASP